MIDFRYHLVSLISVFLALAVGIVLGAGPLRDSLGDQISGQVEQLRTEQDELRAQVEELEGQNDRLASFVTAVGPDLVAGTLNGQEIAVITDDGSTRSPVETTTTLLQNADAAGVTEVRLQTALWDPDQEDRRREAVEQVRSISPALLDDQLDASEQLSTVVVRLLAPNGTEGADAATRSQVWQVLVDEQMVALDGDEVPVADGVVYAGADPSRFAVASDDEATAAARAQGQLAAQSALLDALVGTGLPAVVAGVTPGNDGSTGLLRTVRGEGRFSSLSTTDRLQEPDGPLLAVLALIEQGEGVAGSYGTTTDAEARLPSLPESAGEGAGASDGGTG